MVTAAPMISTSSMPPQESAASQRSGTANLWSSVDDKDGFAFELALSQGIQRGHRVAPACFEADLRLEASGANFSRQQRQIGTEGGRLAGLIDEERVEPGVGPSRKAGKADRAVFAR